MSTAREPLFIQIQDGVFYLRVWGDPKCISFFMQKQQLNQSNEHKKIW